MTFDTGIILRILHFYNEAANNGGIDFLLEFDTFTCARYLFQLFNDVLYTFIHEFNSGGDSDRFDAFIFFILLNKCRNDFNEL